MIKENSMEIFARIKGIEYRPFLCRSLSRYDLSHMGRALSERGSFILEIDKGNELGVSWWVSPKRTRSYPYARVYDTLYFTGKKITIIPVIKDEGRDGDRDFLQWDTISLMSLLGVYVIIAYYVDASRNLRFVNKITDQRFDTDHIRSEILRLLAYQSDALHWNLEQIDRVCRLAEHALDAYAKMSKRLDLKMHSMESALGKIDRLYKEKEMFMKSSRELARRAQKRESATVQPKEYLAGTKAKITIENYLGGYYYFTCDEVERHNDELYLIEGKHTGKGIFPSAGDIKDGLIKMILFTNLKEVIMDNNRFKPVPVLKLTTKDRATLSVLDKSKRHKRLVELLKKEARYNGFKVKINDTFL